MNSIAQYNPVWIHIHLKTLKHHHDKDLDSVNIRFSSCGSNLHACSQHAHNTKLQSAMYHTMTDHASSACHNIFFMGFLKNKRPSHNATSWPPLGPPLLLPAYAPRLLATTSECKAPQLFSTDAPPTYLPLDAPHSLTTGCTPLSSKGTRHLTYLPVGAPHLPATRRTPLTCLWMHPPYPPLDNPPLLPMDAPFTYRLEHSPRCQSRVPQSPTLGTAPQLT